ncbi:MAG: alkaline phosphatase family protein [Armatimonadota bacterium]
MTDATARKVCVIGVDGATFELIRPLAAAGRLPAFSQLLREGASGPLLTVPALNSAAAWSSFITGVNPGKHGIFDFYHPARESYRIRFLNGGDRHGESLWSLLSRENRRVGVINVPMTFPVEPVNGFMIAGLDAPGIGTPGFTHPPSLLEDVQRAAGGYVLAPGMVGYMLAHKEAEGLRQLRRCTEQRLAAALHLMRAREWDFFMVVFSAVDSVQHCFWKYMDPDSAGATDEERRRFADAIPSTYVAMDHAIGRIREALPADTTVIVMSDHGAGPRHLAARQLNPWLASIGLLRFEPPRGGWRGAAAAAVRKAYARLERLPARRLKEFLVRIAPGVRDRVRSEFMVAGIDWAHTKAFADPVGSTIRLNLAGREPSGTVAPDQESEEVLALIARSLLEATDAATGEPAVEAVLRREEAYHGPYVTEAPELTIQWNRRIPVGQLAPSLGDIGDFPIEQYRAISGDHRPEGIVLMAGPGIVPGRAIEGASIMDLFPTILGLMGVGIPAGLDGRLLRSALASDLPEASGAVAPPRAAPQPEQHQYTSDEEEQVRDRLRDLGYLD